MLDRIAERARTRVAFGDLVARVSDSGVPNGDDSRTYIGLEHLDADSLTIRRWGSEVPLVVPKTRIRKGDVLFARRNTHLRRCAVAPFDAYFSPDGYALRSKSRELLQEFLVYVVASDSFMNYAVKHSAGTHSKRVKWSDLAKYEFGLPPLDEQRRVAGALVSIRHADAAYEDMRIAASDLQSSLAQERFSALLMDPAVPVRRLGDLIDGGVSNGIFRKQEQFGTGLPLINVADCYLGFRVPLSHLDRVPASDREYSSFSAQVGDVIFNRSSIVESGIGQACLVPDSQERLLFECHLMRVRPRQTLLLGAFLARYALSPVGRRYLLGRAKTTTMTTISQGDLESMPVPSPDLAAQERIAEELDAIDATIDGIRVRQTRIRAFGAGLLNSVWPA